jgi:hypothetical protein
MTRAGGAHGSDLRRDVPSKRGIGLLENYCRFGQIPEQSNNGSERVFRRRVPGVRIDHHGLRWSGVSSRKPHLASDSAGREQGSDFQRSGCIVCNGGYHRSHNVVPSQNVKLKLYQSKAGAQVLIFTPQSTEWPG